MSCVGSLLPWKSHASCCWQQDSWPAEWSGMSKYTCRGKRRCGNTSQHTGSHNSVKQAWLFFFFNQCPGTRYWLIILLSPPEPFLWLYKIVKNMRTRCVSTIMTKSVIDDKTGHQRTTGNSIWHITTCSSTTSMEQPLTLCHNLVDTSESWEKCLESSERFIVAGNSWKGMENV